MFDNVEYIAIHFKMDVVNMYKGQSVSRQSTLFWNLFEQKYFKSQNANVFCMISSVFLKKELAAKLQ